jgi:uncharacterized protein (DUF58 family)
LVVKVFQQDSRQPLSVVLDSSPSMALGADKWRRARQLTVALAYLALAGRHTCRIHAGQHWLGSWDRLAAIDDVVLAVERATPSGPQPAVALRSAGVSSGNAVLISDLWDESLEPALLAVRRPAQRWSVVRVLSGEELLPSIGGRIELMDSESHERRVCLIDNRIRLAYQRELERQQLHWQELAVRYDLRYALFDCREPLEQELLGALRRAGLIA